MVNKIPITPFFRRYLAPQVKSGMYILWKVNPILGDLNFEQKFPHLI